MQLHNEYRTYNDYKSFSGVECKVGTKLKVIYEENINKIYFNNKFVCFLHSQSARENMCGNDDGMWKERGNLILKIKANMIVLAGSRDEMEEKIGRIISALWEDENILKYNQNKEDSRSPWIWNDFFYCAPIHELQHILDVILNVKQSF